jgi:hypothetical protein
MRVTIKDERFELKVHAYDKEKKQVPIPEELMIEHGQALAKVLHRPGILKIFHKNLKMPVEPLKQLDEYRNPEDFIPPIKQILEYLKTDNPYLLTYRFGPKQGEAMKMGIEEFLSLSEWANHHNLTLHVTPIRRYFDIEKKEDVEQTKQGDFEHWM